jgi:TIR domain-containing protein
MAKVFVSYSTKDRSWKDKIREFLRLLGHDPILDDSDFRAGHGLRESIKTQIASADFFCLVMSRDSMASPWVLDEELPYALSKKLRIIPILLEDCDVPNHVRGLRYVDFTVGWDYGFVELSKALPRGDYDEVESLRTEFDRVRLGTKNLSVLHWLQQIAVEEQDWVRSNAKDIMLRLQQLQTTRGSVNDIYWWLMTHGVFRFQGIESEDMCNAEESWVDSVPCALLTARGVALLNSLHLEVTTQRAMEAAAKEAGGDSSPRSAT